MTAVQEYDANPDAATATYGPIADWDVSAITDMSYLFRDLRNFNADISNWDTSSVTSMHGVFYVRSSRACPNLESGTPRACHLLGHLVLPFHLPARIECPSFDSAERAVVQPAAELGHLQRH